MARTALGECYLSDGSSAGSTGQDLSFYPGILAIYAPGTLHRKEAKVFEIRANKEVTGADFNIDMGGLHTVRGRVLAGEDRHTPTRGLVHLRESGATDILRFAMLGKGGSFEIHYLPSGGYTLELADRQTRRFRDPIMARK